jgi:hypothetical protein
MKTIIPVVAIGMLTFPAAAAPATDIDWYIAHPGERARVIATCNEDPARLAGDPDCQDAATAETQAPHPGFLTSITDFFEDLL